MTRTLFGSIDMNRYPECRDFPLVVSIARKVARQYNNRLCGLDIEDLYQIGWFVLRKCVKHYRENTTTKRGTYIALSLSRAFHRAISAVRRPVRIPHSTLYERGRTTNTTITARQDKTRQQVDRMQQGKAMPLGQELTQQSVGLDMKWIDREFLEHGLSLLTDEERTVIRLYYGLDNQESTNLADIGASGQLSGKFVSKQRVAQIHDIVLQKLQLRMGA